MHRFPIETRTSNGRLIIEFSRPAERNPISERVIYAIESVLAHAANIGPLDEVLFTGKDGSFASGADLKEIRGLDAGHARSFAFRGQSLMDAIAGFPIPTTAFINGHCYGGGLDLALACRRRVAVQRATFCHPGARLGMMTGWGGTQRLPRLIGEGRSLEMFFSAEPISASEALRIGLVDRIAENLDSYLAEL